MTDKEKISKIKELLGDLSDDGIDQFVEEIADNEGILSRLLSLLIKKNSQMESAFVDSPTFIDFLKRVKG